MAPLFGIALGTPEIITILVIGVLLFGRRLPEVGRYLGKGIVEFKKGIKGVEDDIDTQATTYQAPEAPRPPQRVGTTAPKFEENPTS
jgi:sec-independent protein translocase protein TatA